MGSNRVSRVRHELRSSDQSGVHSKIFLDQDAKEALFRGSPLTRPASEKDHQAEVDDIRNDYRICRHPVP
jgi:hypothetical protein